MFQGTGFPSTDKQRKHMVRFGWGDGVEGVEEGKDICSIPQIPVHSLPLISCILQSINSDSAEINICEKWREREEGHKWKDEDVRMSSNNM